MQTYSFGEIVLIAFPFSDSVGIKRRPALVLLDTGDDDILVARITGQLVKSPFDVELQAWQSAGLKLPSVVRLNKLATLEKRLVGRSLGVLSEQDVQQVNATLQRLYQAIG